MKLNTARILFLSALIIDIVLASNVLPVFYLLRRLVPLIVLISLCTILPKIQRKKIQSRIKNFLFVYLIADILLGFVAYNFRLPSSIGFLFYSKNWLSNIVYSIQYEQIQFLLDLIPKILYWIAFGFLLAENKDLSQKNESNVSISFKLAIANLIVLVLQTGCNGFISNAWEDNLNCTGEHALGAAFVAILLIAIKIILALPVFILSLIGIFKAIRKKNKIRRNNQKGLAIHIACLVISGLQVFFWW